MEKDALNYKQYAAFININRETELEALKIFIDIEPFSLLP
jgi:hypothetical protein